jgi:lysophospholipid acyltransferase (LPLAT)-like uncharacterized protein
MRLRSICLILALVWLSGCEDKFRYTCQNPNNWDAPECKKPYCEVSQTCPEHVFADQRKIQEQLEKKEQENGCSK